MDYFKSGEGESSKSNREFEDEKELSKSKTSSSVDVKTTKEVVLRSNTKVQEEDIISVISNDEENLESLNLDNKVKKEESLKSVVSNAKVVNKESNMEETVELNLNVGEVEISKDVLSSVLVGNPSNIDVPTCHPSLIDCTSSNDPNPEETSKSNIADKVLPLRIEFLSMPHELASETSKPNLEEIGLHIHKEKSLNLHQELKQFHSIRKNTPKYLSENKTFGASRQNEDSQPNNKRITKSSSNSKLPSASKESKGSSELKESETHATSLGSSQTLDEQIDVFIQTVSSLLINSSGFSRNLEISRSAEGISSASSENCNSPSVHLEAPIDFHERAFNELNGVKSNKFTGAPYLIQVVLLFEHLLDDLLDIKVFLDGLHEVRLFPCDGKDYGPTLNERLLASIPETFGTGVESTAAQNTRSLISYLIQTRRIAAEAERQGEPSPEASAERGCESLGKFDTEQKTVAESFESEPSVSSSSTSLQESSQLQSTPEFDPRLEAEKNPFDISRQLLLLSRAVRCQLRCFVSSYRDVVAYCVTSSPDFLVSRLERLVDIFLDVLEHLVSLRKDCSTVLSRCRNREDSEDVIYILKVKTHIAAKYNKLLQNLSNLTSTLNANSSKDSD